MSAMQKSKELEYALAAGLFSAFRPGSKTFFEVINEARAHASTLELEPEEWELLNTEIGSFGTYQGEEVPLDFPMIDEGDIADAAEYQGKDVELNKPSKNSGPGGKFKVYVRDPSTGNVKKITFSTSVTKALINDPERRKAFSARHNCPDAKDKLSKSYWSCRVPRMASMLGLGENINAWW